MKKLNLLAALILVSFLGCSSKQTNESRGVSSQNGLTVLFSDKRALNLEPCGCSLGQLGGLEREYNYLSKVRSSGVQPLYLLGSGAYMPQDEFKKKDLKRYRLKAETITEALAKMKVGAYFPDKKDLVIGTRQLQALSKKYGVPFVSSNLVDPKTKKLLFQEKIEFENTLVLGLAGDALSPKETLTRLLAGNTKFTIVVHSLPYDDMLLLMKDFPQVSLWLGGDRIVFPEEVFQPSLTALSGEVQGWGRSLLRFDFDTTTPGAELYNSTIRQYQVSRLQVYQQNQDNSEEMKTRLSLIGGITEKKSDSANEYRFERVDLTNQYAGENELKSLLEYSHRNLSGENIE